MGLDDRGGGLLERARRVARAPLVHFLLLGGVLLAADHLRNPPRAPLASGRILVTRQIVADLGADLARRRGHPPSPEELRAEVDHYVEDEAFFREAVALGLHESDLIVRRRLVQRMRFLHEDMAAAREPSDDELSAYVAAHTERYAPEPRITFEQVFLSRSARGDALARAAELALAELQAGRGAASDAYPLPLGTARQSRGELARVLGPRLADALFEVPSGEWRGPLESSYGLHLVRVTERQRPPVDLAAVRPKAREDLLAERRHAVEQALAASLKDRFEVVREADEAPL
jgi:hypothetical protein